MRLLLTLCLIAWSVLSPPAQAAPASEPRRVEIADPSRYWRDNGFVELTPAIRVSVPLGARTLVYLKIPEGGLLTTRQVARQQRPTIRLPPGSAAARVSLTADEAGTWTVEDVRGTRWDAQGREYFHVYRPRGAEAGAPLVGYEWPRGDDALQDRATALLTDLVRDLPLPFRGSAPAPREVARFRALNDCGSCHQPDKGQASSPFERLPPWLTDASGIYVPLAVLSDRAVLSTTPAFHDPNAEDPFVAARCADGAPASEYVRWGRHFFRCGDGGMPVGIHDMQAARAAGDAHAGRVCASRRHLFERMDEAGRRAFAAAFRACGIG
ncbi:MAG: hypothetical protein L6R19_26700 [Alphaproteobacteria bacterium]|nr:hypothetical protein [Alphaproteobacteria bacterium]